MISTKRIVLITIAIAVSLIVLFWCLLTIPTCTTYPNGTKLCQNYEGPWNRNIWMEK